MTFADFCRDCGQHLCCPGHFFFSATSRQTSRSKTRLIPSVRAGFTPRRPSEYRASESVAPLPASHRPCIRFLFVTSDFCRRLPSDPASRRRPCLWLQVPLTTALRGLAPHMIRAMSGAQRGRRRLLRHSRRQSHCLQRPCLPEDQGRGSLRPA